MERCTQTYGLEVYHKDRNGDNGLYNTEVLCQACHEATASYVAPGVSAPVFSEETKYAALMRADNQCECIRTEGCH